MVCTRGRIPGACKGQCRLSHASWRRRASLPFLVRTWAPLPRQPALRTLLRCPLWGPTLHRAAGVVRTSSPNWWLSVAELITELLPRREAVLKFRRNFGVRAVADLRTASFLGFSSETVKVTVITVKVELVFPKRKQL